MLLHKCTNYKECILFFFGQLLCAIEMTLAGGNSLAQKGVESGKDSLIRAV